MIRRFGTPGVTVEGHTDSTGGSALNERLSQERAEVVRRFLVDNEVVPPHRVMAIGRGAEAPLAPNDTPEGRRLNRRIDIVIDTRELFLLARERASSWPGHITWHSHTSPIRAP